ncbi:YvbH-like oligomerisation region [Halobacillus karajensis]|uniref:YvbH-like oligomerisation region n=1 Tax=Halobacillus karajensis TaxID=195088 RepID=A0A024P8Y4_9BACI|nr:PH domain-containing protein [Halobacillus karajensis]CDQ21465.1 YvbH-like oligomerisation region [Halobacillus karajensis]CDQ25400.1 YvbH-like oligomerisation region [Halobacillus karajensis]CDQ29724.1 YvbH-like oligomerisation region [Halobacillus karajensis]SEI07944.1 YvbH-like oligomerisation region [Halobacillus karajensis]
MFKKIASDALGLSDIGKIIKKEDFDKAQSDDFVLTEDGEKIYFLIKSKSDEYCFTNRALIHLDGDKATSNKRYIYRYDYYQHPIKNVSVETAGTIDLDLEIKFHIGDHYLSIDIAKDEGEAIADLYKSLVAISQIQEENDRMSAFAKDSIGIAQNLLHDNRFHESDLSREFNESANFAYDWFKQTYKENTRKDFDDVFEKYIQN